MVDHDPLDVLRSAWRAVEPPAPDMDSATDALVDDLREAWSELEVPALSPETLRVRLLARQELRDRAARWRDRATLVAAASLLLALVFGAAQSRHTRRTGGDQIASRGDKQNAVNAPQAANSNSAPSTAIAADMNVRRFAPDVQAHVSEDGELELRYGRVRLLYGGERKTVITTHERDATHADQKD